MMLASGVSGVISDSIAQRKGADVFAVQRVIAEYEQYHGECFSKSRRVLAIVLFSSSDCPAAGA